jgi:copper chaperone CopZ
MKIEVLYFSVCPHHAPAVDRVSEVLEQEGVTADMVEVEVTDPAAAQLVGFLGSPTLRVDGQDVEPAARAARAFGITCRTYIDDGQRAGVPPLEWIRAAVREAKEGEHEHRKSTAVNSGFRGVVVLPLGSGRPLAASPVPQNAERTAWRKTADIRIAGMTCAACAKGLEASFRKMTGAVKADVVCKAGVAVITCGSAKQNTENLSKVVAECGHLVEEIKVV